jgi:hypothetical protein
MQHFPPAVPYLSHLPPPPPRLNDTPFILYRLSYLIHYLQRRLLTRIEGRYRFLEYRNVLNENTQESRAEKLPQLIQVRDCPAT